MIGKKSHFIFIIGIVGILAASCSGVHFAQKKFEIAKANAPYDVVIVPGVPYKDTSGLAQIFNARILWAKYLYDKGITKNVIFSGSAIGSPYYEGLVMKISADSMGIPSKNTFAEMKAEHSTENVWYSMKMAEKMGFKKVALATDPFQTRMLKGFLRKRCNKMPVVPIVFSWIDPEKDRILQIPEINPSAAFKADFVPLSKRESFWERWKGTRGKHINFKE